MPTACRLFLCQFFLPDRGARRVDVKVIRELYGVMVANGAEYGVIVVSGEYTSEAVKFASANHIELISGTRLTGMIRSAQQ